MTAEGRGMAAANTLGIALLVAGIFCISANDMLVKVLSDAYPLYQIVFVRSVIGLLLNYVPLAFEGGPAALRTSRPGLQAVRALLVVGANLAFFAGLVLLPIATANALFFIAPLLITLLSIPMLGIRVGPRRIGAVAVGFLGVLMMLGAAAFSGSHSPLAMLLPVVAATCYALMQVLTRKLSASATAAAMTIYIHATFILVSAVAYVAAGDGRFAAGSDNAAIRFVFGAWVWPEPGDVPLFAGIGALVAVMSYCMTQAYRIADTATIAPFEYVALPLAAMWGLVIFGEALDAATVAGMVLIAGSGLYVFARERIRGPLAVRSRPGVRR